MANMSYCRWENTSRDFAECVNDLSHEMDGGISVQEYYDDLSDYEKVAFWSMIENARELLNLVDSQDIDYSKE